MTTELLRIRPVLSQIRGTQPPQVFGEEYAGSDIVGILDPDRWGRPVFAHLSGFDLNCQRS